MNVELKISLNTIKVMVNGCVHVILKKDELIGIQNWVEGTGKWCIEYYLKDNSILCEYDSKHKWDAILKELEKIEF